MRFATLALLAAALAVAGCAADPYNAFPDAARVERIVVGSSSLQVQDPRPGSSEYFVYEGRLIPDGGIIWQPFYLTEQPVTPRIGDAVLARKARWPEVFGLLTRGAVGESAENRLVPRVGAGEFTERERMLVDAENRDRALILQAVLEGRRVPAEDAASVARVFAYTRYQQMPDGIWVERSPGRWVIKGGRDYRARVMEREPVAMDPGPEPSLEPMPPSSPGIEAPRPRVRR